jgi:hypothetical protein
MTDPKAVSMSRPLWSLIIGAPVFKTSPIADSAGRHEMAMVFPTPYGPVGIPINKPKIKAEELIGMLNMPITVEPPSQAEDADDDSSNIITE